MNQKIKVENVVGPVQVTFRAGLDTNGDVTEMYISKFGNYIQLTREQAMSLAKVITQRFGTLEEK